VVEIQRARILAAMVDVSAERGASNATVAHVVQRAGVSRRTFYELFEDREDCFLAAFDEGVARASRHVLGACDPSLRWAERIRAGLLSLLCFLDAEPDTARLLLLGSLAAGPAALERRERVIARLAAAVDEGRAESKKSSPPPLTAEGIVGGALSVLHSRLIGQQRSGSTTRAPEPGFLDLLGPLMGMIVLPYMGQAASRRENAIPTPKNPSPTHHHQKNPLGRLEMRLTYRTVRVLMAIAAHPGSSNRVVATAAEVSDQGQMSKLLARLHNLGLIANAGGGAARGEPNAWTLTKEGQHIHKAITEQTHP
jgi:AcrR family transcriptional regulator